MDPAPKEWYKPGPSIRAFHASTAETRALVGGRGSGKTTAIAVEVVKHAWHIAGAKAYLLRKTQSSNEDTSLETFERVFAKLGSAYIDTGASLFKKMEGGRVFRLPSAKAVEKFNRFVSEGRPSKSDILRWLDSVGNVWCSFLVFAGIPSEQYRSSRLRGFECSMLVLIEADQFEQGDMEYANACLRWSSPDPDVCDDRGYIKAMCMIWDTNPPGKKHWIALAEEQARTDGDKSIAFWHIPTQENEDNLPPGYVAKLKRTWRNNPAMYRRMVLGEYADAFDGKPVLFAFRHIEHASQNLQFPRGAYLVRGWDFGTTHAVVWSAYWLEAGQEYWWDLLEYYAEQSDVEQQCRAVHRLTDTVFPYWNDRQVVSGVLDYCDPAGNQKKDTGCSLRVLQSYGFAPGFCYVGFQEQLAIYNRLLEKQDRFGRWVYRVDERACPMLYTASSGGYRYPSVGEPGHGTDKPLKGPSGGNFDHVVDAARYAKTNCLRLIRAEVTKAAATGGALAPPLRVNRQRKWL